MTAPRCRRALYVSYNSAFHPLVESQVVAYLAELHRLHGWSFQLITFEPRQALANDKERRVLRQRLRQVGITWTARRYHQRPTLPATAWDTLIGAATILAEVARCRPALIHARSHVPAAMALLPARLFEIPLLFDCRGLFADAYVDWGHWSRSGVPYRLTKLLEPLLFKASNHVVVLTARFRKLLQSGRFNATLPSEKMTAIPCCVDLGRFEAANTSGHSSLTLAFCGSVGNWYLLDEMLDFCTATRELVSELKLKFINRDEHELIHKGLADHGLAPISEVIAADPLEVPRLLRDADAGIAFLRPTLSMQAASPTKIGEYLAMGLPVVFNRGIGDLDEQLQGVGVAIDSFSGQGYSEAARRLLSLTQEEGVHQRCRARAEELFALSLGVERYARVYELLAASPR